MLRLSPRLLHAALRNERDPIIGMEPFRIAQVSRVEAGLHVFDILNVLLRVLDQLVDIDLLSRGDGADVVGKVVPLAPLVAHGPLHEIQKRRLVRRILDHAQPRERADLEACRLLVRLVHEVTDEENEGHDVQQGHRVAERVGNVDDIPNLGRDFIVVRFVTSRQCQCSHARFPVVMKFKGSVEVQLIWAC